MKNKIKIDNIDLNYFESGSGKVILFLHGGRLQALTHRSLLLKLSKRYRVIAPDIPGYGSSSTPKKLWNFKNYAVFFDKFMKRINIKEVIVIGYSLGGGIAYNLANISPDVKKLVLIDSAGIEKTKEKEFIRDVKRVYFYLSNPKYFLTFITLIKEFIMFIFNHLRGPNIKNIRNNLNDFVGYKKNFKTPTLIIWAKNDEIFSVSIAKKLNKSIKNSKLFLVNYNHDWILYTEDKLMDILNKALM